jgi:HTH-type transcriptional regulator/antitoxin HigA
MMRNIRPIRSDDDLAWAIAEVSPYFENPPQAGTEDADRFDVLSDLIEAYENRHHAIDAPEPIELLKGFMEMTGRTQKDLALLLGSRPRASEIINRKRALTVDMIQKLNDEWGVPAARLVQSYALKAA